MLLNIITYLRPYSYSSPTQLSGHENNTYASNTNLFDHSNFKCFYITYKSRPICSSCRARRRVRYEDVEENDDDDDGYNEEIGILEMYSHSARGEALLVTAMVDDQQVEVLIFKGFSSCLSYKTSSDPSKSVLPQRARIKSIDRIKGPFNPANIDYIEKGLTFETFISRFSSTS